MEFKITELMIENSLISKGNTSKIAEVMKKAKDGEDITVAFLGGSITQGCNATSFEECYATRTYKWFENKFSNINVKYVNAGVGATGSIIGVHRADGQVLREKPDIIFIDFAVNDKNTIYDKVSYESLVRRILSVDNPPAIIEVFMSNFDGSNVQAQQIEIGEKYKIPMISFRNSVFAEINNSDLKWEDIASDEVHPNDYGHFIISELLINFMENIYSEMQDINTDKIDLGTPIFGDKYINGVIKNSNNIKLKENNGFIIDNEGFQVFKGGWKCNCINGKEAILKAEIEGNNIFLLYKKTIKECAGKFKISVDNKESIIVDTYFENGWGDYSATEVLVEDDINSIHNIEVTVIGKDENSEATIMGFLVS